MSAADVGQAARRRRPTLADTQADTQSVTLVLAVTRSPQVVCHTAPLPLLGAKASHQILVISPLGFRNLVAGFNN